MFSNNDGYQKQHDVPEKIKETVAGEVVNQETVGINFDELHFNIFNSKTKYRYTLSNDLRFELLDIIQHDDEKRFKKFIKKNDIYRHLQIILSGKAECQNLSFISKNDSTLEDLLSFFGKYKICKEFIYRYNNCTTIIRTIDFAVWGGQLAFLKEFDKDFSIYPIKYINTSGFLLHNHRFGDPEITKLLLRWGVPQTTSPSGHSPLMYMIQRSKLEKSLIERENYIESAKLLLEQYKNQISVRCRHGYSPYIYAMDNDDEPMISLLLNYKPVLNKKDLNWIFSRTGIILEKHITHLNKELVRFELSEAETYSELIHQYGKQLSTLHNLKNKLDELNEFEALFSAKTPCQFQSALIFYQHKNLLFVKNKFGFNLLVHHINKCFKHDQRIDIAMILLNQEGLRWFPNAMESMNKTEEIVLLQSLDLCPSMKNYLFRLWLREKLNDEALKQFHENENSQPMAVEQFSYLDSADLKSWNIESELILLARLLIRAQDMFSLSAQIGVADFGLAILGKKLGLGCFITHDLVEMQKISISLGEDPQTDRLLDWLQDVYTKLIKQVGDFDPLYEKLKALTKLPIFSLRSNPLSENTLNFGGGPCFHPDFSSKLNPDVLFPAKQEQRSLSPSSLGYTRLRSQISPHYRKD
jgi:hypothetical protein